MKKALLLVFILIGGFLLPAAAKDKNILVAPGATHSGNINAYRSFLDIAGKVDASVFLVGGRLRLSGGVSGDVICLGSQVDIKDGAVIGRDLIVIGGSVTKAPGCKISGDFYYIRTKEDLKKIARTMLPFLPESGGLTFFKISKIFFWFILIMLALAAAAPASQSGRGHAEHNPPCVPGPRSAGRPHFHFFTAYFHHLEPGADRHSIAARPFGLLFSDFNIRPDRGFLFHRQQDQPRF